MSCSEEGMSCCKAEVTLSWGSFMSSCEAGVHLELLPSRLGTHQGQVKSSGTPFGWVQGRLDLQGAACWSSWSLTHLLGYLAAS